jgi:hypothetical protein
MRSNRNDVLPSGDAATRDVLPSVHAAAIDGPDTAAHSHRRSNRPTGPWLVRWIGVPPARMFPPLRRREAPIPTERCACLFLLSQNWVTGGANAGRARVNNGVIDRDVFYSRRFVTLDGRCCAWCVKRSLYGHGTLGWQRGCIEIETAAGPLQEPATIAECCLSSRIRSVPGSRQAASGASSIYRCPWADTVDSVGATRARCWKAPGLSGHDSP